MNTVQIKGRVKRGILDLFLWLQERYVLWVYGQTVNILWNILWSVNSQSNGKYLQYISKIIEEEPVKKIDL